MSSSPPPCSKAGGGGAAGKYCLCAPTTHPGSFRCRLHRSPTEDKAATAPVSPPPGVDQEAKEAAAAAAARALLERMVARKPRRQGVPATFRPGPSRLGTTATAMDD